MLLTSRSLSTSITVFKGMYEYLGLPKNKIYVGSPKNNVNVESLVTQTKVNGMRLKRNFQFHNLTPSEQGFNVKSLYHDPLFFYRPETLLAFVN